MIIEVLVAQVVMPGAEKEGKYGPQISAKLRAVAKGQTDDIWINCDPDAPEASRLLSLKKDKKLSVARYWTAKNEKYALVDFDEIFIAKIKGAATAPASPSNTVADALNVMGTDIAIMAEFHASLLAAFKDKNIEVSEQEIQKYATTLYIAYDKRS